MILDFNSATASYILRVPRNSMPVDVLLREYGMNFSVPESTPATAVLFTRDPFCAASFHEYATPAARAQLDWIAREVAASSAASVDRHVDIPQALLDRGVDLMPFQRADVDYIMRRDHALDGDEMGLGKTPTAIAVANEMQAQRVLVVCPAAVRLQWLRRIAEWSTLDNPFCYAVTSARYGTSESAEWTVVSYDLARKPGILRGLVKQRFDLLILDEVHNCKTVSAARTRSIFGYHDGRPDDGESEDVVTACLAECCTRVLALSGTPILNRPSEAYTIMRGLNWDSVDWMSEKGFRERFNPQSKGKTNGKVWAHEEEGRLPELGNRMRAYVMCRHLEKDVRDQLKYAFPEPIYDLIYLEETRAVKQALEAERLLDIDPETLAGADIEILGQISTVRKMMGIAMAPQVADYVAELLDGGNQKLVLFAWHIEVLDILCAKLAPYGAVRVDGSDAGNSKDAKVQRFVSDPAFRIIIGNTLALGVGVDGLQTVSSHVLLAEPDWVPGNNEQPIRRLNRIGQLSRVLADFFVVAGSMSERVLATALRKGQVIDKVLDRNVLDLTANAAEYA